MNDDEDDDGQEALRRVLAYRLAMRLSEICGVRSEEEEAPRPPQVPPDITALFGIDLHDDPGNKVAPLQDTVLDLDDGVSRRDGTGRPVEIRSAGFALDQVVLAQKAEREIRMFLERFRRNQTEGKKQGIRLLFHGMPGTGKTMTAEAIAGELNRRFVVVSVGEIEAATVGYAEARLSKVFAYCEKNDVVLVLDEVDAMLINREQASQEYSIRTTNHLLRLLDNSSAMVVLCTNRLKGLDPAIRRRISDTIELGLPDFDARVVIWRQHLKDAEPLSPNISPIFPAVFPMTGGLIRNAVEFAMARRDAEGGQSLLFRHMLDGVANQLENMAAMLEQYEISIAVSARKVARRNP